MMQKALEQRWPVREEFRAGMITRLMRIIADPKSTAREVTAASKALIAAEGQNQLDEHKVIDVRVTTRNDQLAGIAADLGIEVGLVEDVTRKADLGIGSIEGESVPAAANKRA